MFTSRRLCTVERLSLARYCNSLSSKQYTIRNKGNIAVRVGVDLECSNKLNCLPHIVFAGLTNAGKSSVLNHLLRKKNFAKASSVHAKTRLVDQILVNESAVFVDTPGLPGSDGRFTKEWSKDFFPQIELYLEKFDANTVSGLLIFIHDVNKFTTENEKDYLKFLRKKVRFPPLLLLSKDDKLHSHEQRIIRTEKIREALDIESGVPHIHYSVKSDLRLSRNGRRTVLRFIDSIAKANSMDEVNRLVRNRKFEETSIS